MIAGLPLVCTERVEHYYKSMGWSLFHKDIEINTINYPHVYVLRPKNLTCSKVVYELAKYIDTLVRALIM